MRELLFSRHVDWSPNPLKSYNDYQVEDFLALCGVPAGRLITGHTPLARETGWDWDIGRHLTVIFAAGREVGYLKVTEDGEEMVRVGRSLVTDDETLIPDRWPNTVPHGTEDVERGRRRIRLTDLATPLQLLPDVLYRLDYPGSSISLDFPTGQRLRVCHYRHLSPASQAYYEHGYYLTGNELLQEVLKLKRDLAVLIGGSSLIEGVRVSWGDEELAVLRMPEDGVFDLRPLVEGLRLQG